jgi:molybdenum cofactor cytidylyltransferase
MNLREALAMDQREVVSNVGGGGKTTVLYRLARETVEAGGKAVVTGTTRFTPPEGAELPPAVLNENTEELLAELQEALGREPLVVAGAGWGNQGRIMPVEPHALARIATIEGVAAVVAEADGSAGRPFKAPAAHEPVVAPSTTLLLTDTGLDVIGRPLDAEHVHRPEIVAELSGAELGAPVTEALVARVLLDPNGGRKGLPAGARWLPVLNKADTAERLEAARRIARMLLDGGAQRVLIARAGSEPPVMELLD